MPEDTKKEDSYSETKDKLGKEMADDLKKIDKLDYSTLEEQIKAEFSVSWDHQQAKKTEALLRLKLYNNQMRDKDAVGDTTMFTIHQTLLASLYNDRLEAEWIGREEGDDEVAENLTQVAQFDYEAMEKDVTDFNWDWDTLFFGRGLCNLTEFVRDPDKGIYLPVPEIWDPTTFLRDPRAVSVNGDTWTGKNSARFYGRGIRMTKEAMKDSPNFFKNIDWDSVKYGGGTKSLVDTASQARAEAQGLSYSKLGKEHDFGDNAEYELLEWHTHWMVRGDLMKVTAWMANKNTKLLGFRIDGDCEKKWGLIDRPLYPTSHDWDGTSVPDLTEDKQRQRAIAQNLGLRAMTADMYPNYIYDQNKVKNRNDLQFGFNKFIPVDGDPTAILPMRKAAPNMQLLDFIYNTLDISAQKATATPEIQQGQQSQQKRTLGEVNIIASKVDTRYSLSAKIFGWSEKAFWRQWYTIYKDNFADDIDEKTIRIVGAFGGKYRKMMRDNIIAHTDPDVKIESQVVSRAKQMEDRQALGAYFGLALQDPTANKRWALKKLGKLNGLMRDEMDRLFPPTIDEMQAEDENELLNDNKAVQVLAEQDHVVHLEIHAKCNPTKTAKAHIETHKRMLMIMKEKALAEAKAKAAQPVSQGGVGNIPTPGGIPPQPGSGIPNIMGANTNKGIVPSDTSGMTK